MPRRVARKRKTEGRDPQVYWLRHWEFKEMAARADNSSRSAATSRSEGHRQRNPLAGKTGCWNRKSPCCLGWAAELYNKHLHCDKLCQCNENELENLKQKSFETIAMFSQHFRTLADIDYPLAQCGLLHQERLCQIYERMLNDKAAWNKMVRRGFPKKHPWGSC